MPKLRNVIRISASPDEVWNVLGDPLATPSWIPGLADARIDGKVRVCTTTDGNEIVEEVDYSDADRQFEYVQRQVPLPVKDSRGRMTVEAEGDGAEVLWDAEFEVLDPSQETEVVGMIDGFYKQTLESLRRCVESNPIT